MSRLIDRIAARARPLLTATLLPLLGLSSACTYNSYEQGTVKRVETRKSVSAESTALTASWTSAREGAAWQARMAQRGFAGALAASKAGAKPTAGATETAPAAPAEGRALKVSLERLAQVSLERTRAYNTIEWSSGIHPAVVLWELLELATSGLYILIVPPLVLLDLAPPQDRTFQTPAYAKLLIATAPLNPFVSIFGSKVTRTENVEEVRFRDEPVALAYRMRVPVPETSFEYRLLDAAGREVGKGASRTDIFGEAYLEGAAASTASVEVKGSGFAASARL